MSNNCKLLYIISLSFILFSCGSQNNIKKNKETKYTSNKVQNNVVIPVIKPKIIHENKEDFFKENISDITKNDNTISYGSIVSAKPEGYKIMKDYFPSVGQNFRQRYVILHYTALDNDKSISVLTQQSVSSHYLVNDLDDEQIYQLVDENKRAYHAGVSQWRNDSQLNDTSIGIEIVNKGYTSDASGAKIFPLFPPAQIKKVAALVKDIVTRYNIPATNVLAHSDIAPTRKQDPGPQFPWKQLYNEYQIGMWYDDTVFKNYFDQASAMDFTTLNQDSAFVFKYQTDLKNFGYGIEPNGILDDATKKTIEAFQYHFRPANYSGVMDQETWAVLQALLLKYPKK